MPYEPTRTPQQETGWFKSSFSSPSQSCVEVNGSGTMVGVRDTKLAPASPILAFPPSSWTTFTAEFRQH